MRPATPAPRATTPLDLERLADAWQRALDAGDRALSSNRDTLPAEETVRRRRELNRERAATATLLLRVADAAHVRPAP
ncbi:MAG: hypothetical protein ACXWYS_06455, partial [Gaiellaceae bacterium]